MIPTRVVGGRYLVLELAGQGVMGPVWRAEDRLSGRIVAVREMHLPPSLGEAEHALFRDRLLREARAVGRVRDAGLVRVLDVVADGGVDHLVTELVGDRSLSEVVASGGPLSPERTAVLARRLLGTLAAAHALGLVHGSVRPRSIVLDEGGARVALTDVGVVRAVDDPRLLPGFAAPGSEGYVAPERVRGGPLTPATDLWGLGAALFHAVAGRGPYDRGEPDETRAAVLDDQRAPLACAEPLAAAITALLRPEPASRPTAEEALTMLPAEAPWSRRRWPWSRRR